MLMMCVRGFAITLHESFNRAGVKPSHAVAFLRLRLRSCFVTAYDIVAFLKRDVLYVLQLILLGMMRFSVESLTTL